TVPTGNVVLDYLLGPDIVWAGDLDYYGVEAAIDEACAKLEAEGRRPYAMPIGGARAVGAPGSPPRADQLGAPRPELAAGGAAGPTPCPRAGPAQWARSATCTRPTSWSTSCPTSSWWWSPTARAGPTPGSPPAWATTTASSASTSAPGPTSTTRCRPRPSRWP